MSLASFSQPKFLLLRAEVVRSIPSLFLVGSVRHGGGGRPGGRPAFDWKEKLVLKIPDVKLNAPRKKYHPSGVHLRGDYSTIEHLMVNVPDEDKITLRGEGAATDEELQAFVDRIQAAKLAKVTEPSLKISQLFGSHKTFGTVGKRTGKKPNFSHKRVFGSK